MKPRSGNGKRAEKSPPGMSHDDSGSFIPAHTEAEIIKKTPFASIDQTGLDHLIKIAVEKGRQT